MTRPPGSSSRTASALNLGGWVSAAAGGSGSARTQKSNATATRNTVRYSSRKVLTNRRFELRRGLEPRRAARDGDGVARSRVAQRARSAARHRKRAETDQRDRLATPKRAADGGQHRTEGPLGRGARPPGGLRHAHDYVRTSHRVTYRRRSAPRPLRFR